MKKSRERARTRRGEDGGKGRRPEKPPAGRARRRPRPAWLFVVVLLGAVALGAWALLSPGALRPRAVPRSPSDLLQSLAAAERRQDWGAALPLAERLVATATMDPRPIFSYGVVLHNYSFSWTQRGRFRPLTRTSLERMEAECRAVVMVDSAIAQMSPGEDWGMAMLQGGLLFETLGLSCEALQRYTAIQQHLPNRPNVLRHLVFVEESLRDPLTMPSGQRKVYDRPSAP